MKKVHLLFITCTLCLFFSCGEQPQSQSQSQSQQQPVSVIFDTDMSPDYDDVGALTMLHAFADKGEANILATVSSNMYPNAVPCIEIINTYFNRPDIPLGAPRQGPNMVDPRFENMEYWPDVLPTKYPHKVKSSADAPDAVEVYRRILAAQPDTSVTIVTVGFLTNLAALLETSGDQYSDLNGSALVKKKVRMLVSMAGGFPRGREFNVMTDSTASVTVFNEWPTPVLLSGFEIGSQVITGPRLVASEIQNSPIKDAFTMGLKLDVNGRQSWDQTAVLVAVCGPHQFFDTIRGRMIVQSNGSNTWQDDQNGPHERLAWKKDELTRYIEDMMMYQP